MKIENRETKSLKYNTPSGPHVRLSGERLNGGSWSLTLDVFPGLSIRDMKGVIKWVEEALVEFES